MHDSRPKPKKTKKKFEEQQKNDIGIARCGGRTRNLVVKSHLLIIRYFSFSGGFWLRTRSTLFFSVSRYSDEDRPRDLTIELEKEVIEGIEKAHWKTLPNRALLKIGVTI